MDSKVSKSGLKGCENTWSYMNCKSKLYFTFKNFIYNSTIIVYIVTIVQ